MNGLVAPKPTPAALSRWTRPAEFLVYLVPVGTISAELYESYVRLLQSHTVIPIRSLTRPGGYVPELSPFGSFTWDGPGSIRLRFVSTTDKIDTFDGEDVHACARAVGVLGICHCPTTPSLATAYQQFMDSIRHFPGLLIHKCFAFEHLFDLRTVEECASLSHLVMFPVYHELANGDGIESGEIISTVSLHLQVVLDTLCVTILMSLESTVRAALRQVQAQANAPTHAIDISDTAGFLLDTNIEPSNSYQQVHHANVLSPFPSRESMGSGGLSPSMVSSPSTPSSDRASSGAAAPSGGNVASLFASAETKSRKRHLARQRKLFGDYAVLLSCLPDAIEHYLAAIELLRDEERKSGGSAGDTLWLAAALEGYIYCLCQQSQDKFLVEVVEKASEAVALYARASVSELEISLIENIGWYYTAVALQLSALKGLDKVEEATWVKRLLWELIERGAMVFSELSAQRQVRFLIESASMLEAVGHQRRMAFVLHEAAAVIIQKWGPSNPTSKFSPGGHSNQPYQRTQELHAAIRLEMMTAQRLGMVDRFTWEATSYRRRTRRLRRLQRQLYQKKAVKVTLAMAIHDIEPWLVLRFHILRQLVTIAKMLSDPVLVGRYCIELLQVLTWCDEFASDTSPCEPSKIASALQIDQAQTPFSVANWRSSLATGTRAGLHNRNLGTQGNNYNGVYAAPPASMEIKAKRYFTMANSPSSTMSSAAATITSTITNTPRTLLSTPRQQFSAAVNAISTKATPALSSFSHGGSHVSSPSFSISLSNRSSSATSADFVSGPHIANTATGISNGLRSSLAEVDGTKGNGHTAQENVNLSTSGDGVLPVWNFCSRVEIQRLQRSVLDILETECAIMRPTDQVKLDSFVKIHKMRICYEVQDSPLLSRVAMLTKCGRAPTGNSSDSSSPPFFYSPFDRKSERKSGSASRSNSSSDSDFDSSESEVDEAITSFELSFPVNELIQVEIVLSNPFGMDLDIQQVALWISAGSVGEMSKVLPPSISANAEAYPSSVVLKPYERRKKVVLSARCLRSGIFHVSGCFVKVFNIKTSFRLGVPLLLNIVEPHPSLDISLLEIGCLSEESSTSELLEQEREATKASNASTPRVVSMGDPMCMFTNEIKRCVIIVRNAGLRPVQTLHITVRGGKAEKSLNLVPENIVMSSLHPGTKAKPLVYETDGMVFRCSLNHQSIASHLPLGQGDHFAIPFEVSLCSLTRHEDTRFLHTLREQLEWSFLYGEGNVEALEDASDCVYYRQSQYVVTLVPLASLVVHRADVLPRSAGPPPKTSSDDSLFCLIAVEITNPTETVFLLRVRTRLADSQGIENASNDDTSTSPGVEWDMEMGRQSSKTLVIEVPRLEAGRLARRSLADVLNESVMLTWQTYFNTSGRLLFHDRLWSPEEQELARIQLSHSDLEFRIAPGYVDAPTDASNVVVVEGANDRLVGFPFRFYQTPTPIYPPRVLSVKVFEPCTLNVQVLARMRGCEGSCGQLGCRQVEAEVIIKPDSESEDESWEVTDGVWMSGPSQRILTSATAQVTGAGMFWKWEWVVKLIFLTEGAFEVSVLGCLADEEGKFQSSNAVAGHCTVRISCSR